MHPDVRGRLDHHTGKRGHRRAELPAGVPVGLRHRGIPGRGCGRRGRAHPVDLGHLLAHPRQDRERGHRRRRRRPLPPVPRRRRAHGPARPHVLPVLGVLAADHPPGHGGRARTCEPGGRRVLLGAGRRADRRGHHAVGHAVPLGPPAGARGRRRLDLAAHGRALRRVRGDRGGGAGRPRAALHHAERAVVQRLPRLRQRRPRPGPHGRRRRAVRGAPPQPRARPRHGRGPPGRARRACRTDVEPGVGGAGDRLRAGRRRRVARRRAAEPGVPRPGPARPLPRRRARRHRRRSPTGRSSRRATWRSSAHRSTSWASTTTAPHGCGTGRASGPRRTPTATAIPRRARGSRATTSSSRSSTARRPTWAGASTRAA